MWTNIVCVLLLANSWAQVSANGEGWGWGGGSASSGSAQSGAAQPQASNGNYWWMSSNPFQKPANHPGVERGDGAAGSYNRPQPQVSYQQKPNYGGNQQSSSVTYQPSGPSNSYNQPQVQAPAPVSIGGGSYNTPAKPQPIPVKPQVVVQSGSSYGPVPVKPVVQVQPSPQGLPSYGGPEPSQTNFVIQPVPVAPSYNNNGNGWGAPEAPARPGQNYNPPSIDFDECKLTNKADCHKGSYNQVDYQPVPVVPVVPQYQQPAPQPTIPVYQPAAPAPQPSYQQPAPQPSYQQPAPAPQPSYQQPAPVAPKPSYQQPAPVAPQPSYQQPAPVAPQPSYQQPAPPKPAYQQPAPRPVQSYQPVPPANNYQRPAQPNYNVGNNAAQYGEQPPYPGCPAAMLCVPDNQCDAEGKISETPLALSEAEKVYRVALSACSSPSTGAVGVCCRDPNYKDPWPDMNGGGGQHHHHDNGHKGNPNPQPSNNFNSYAEPQAPGYAAAQLQPNTFYNCTQDEQCVARSNCPSVVTSEESESDIILLQVSIRSSPKQPIRICGPSFDGQEHICCKQETSERTGIQNEGGGGNLGNPILLPPPGITSPEIVSVPVQSQVPLVQSVNFQTVPNDRVNFPNSPIVFTSDPRIEQGPFSIIIPRPEQIRPGERIRITLNSNVGGSVNFNTPVFETRPESQDTDVVTSSAKIRDEPLVPVPSRPSPPSLTQSLPDRSSLPSTPGGSSSPGINFNEGGTSKSVISSQPLVSEPVQNQGRSANPSAKPRITPILANDPTRPLLGLQLPRLEASKPTPTPIAVSSTTPETTTYISLLELDKRANYVVVSPKVASTTTTTTQKPLFPGFTNPPPVQPYTTEQPPRRSSDSDESSVSKSKENQPTRTSNLVNAFGTKRRVEHVLTPTGEQIRVPSQYYEPPGLTPEDFLRLFAPPHSSGLNKRGSEIQLFSPVAKASSSSSAVEQCSKNQKCLSANLCADPNPSDGDSDDFDIRSQMKKPKRQRCKQPNLPTEGYCCYLREDFKEAQASRRSEPQGEAIAVRKSHNTCGVRRPTGSELRSEISTNTSFGEFPWQVLILRKDDSTCGGAIIDKRIILTTAACVNGISLEDIKLLVGEWDTRHTDEIKPYQEVLAKAINIHPGFKYVGSTAVHNLALIFTETKLKYDYHVSPICLPDAITKFDEQRCITTGWFYTSDPSNTQLKKAHVPVVSAKKCQEKLQDMNLDLKNTHRTSICAGGESTVSTCTDHIGSPLICEDEYTGTYTLAGLLSWWNCDGQTSRPALYTSIAAHTEWISTVRNKAKE